VAPQKMAEGEITELTNFFKKMTIERTATVDG
jgi:hypothetical protein